MARDKNTKFRACIQIFLCILLISSIIQIIPPDVKIIEEVSASSTWFDTNWSTPSNYSIARRIDIINNNGNLKLHYGPKHYVLDSGNSRIVETMMDGIGWDTYGSSGAGTGQFSGPAGVFFNRSSGYLYISDSSNSRLVKTKMGGSGWTTYGSSGTGTGQFNGPDGLYFDNNTGYIYVADTGNHRIIRTMMNGSGWKTYGSMGSGTGQFNSPRGVHFDNNTGYLYIADTNNNRIVKTKMDGTGWTTYGSVGFGTGQFNWPYRTYYNSSSGFIYVTDKFNHRIVKTKIDGTGWTTYGSFGRGGIGKFFQPGALKYDSATDLFYIGDTGNSRIVKTKMDGSGWTSYGSLGSGIGQFRFVTDIALGEKGYCANGYLESKKYDLNGSADILSMSGVADTPQNTSVKFQLRTGQKESDLESKAFVGPGGKTTSYYNISGASVWTGHNGGKWLQYRVYLNTTNVSITPIFKNVTIIYNLLPASPTIISPEDNTWTNDNATAFIWMHNDTDSIAQGGFQWQVDDNINFDSLNYDTKRTSTAQSSYIHSTPISDDIWYWRIRTQDSDGSWGPYSSPYKIFIDTKPPTSKVTFPKNNTYYNNLDTITGTSFDPNIGTGVDKVELSIKSFGNNKYWDGVAWTSGVTWLLALGNDTWIYDTSTVVWTSGTQYGIQTRAYDNVTNLEIPGNEHIFNFDIDRPISYIEMPLNNSFYNKLDSISGTALDIGGAGVDRVEIEIQADNDTYWDDSGWSSSPVWLETDGITAWEYDSSSVKWSSGNHYIISSRAIDNSSNVELPSEWIKFNFDTDEPLSMVEYPSDDAFLNHIATISGSATDGNGAGIDAVSITIKRESDDKYWNGEFWYTNEYRLPTEGTDEWTYDANNIEWTSDIYYTIHSSTTDLAGNKYFSSTGNTFMYDDNPPYLSISINDDLEFTNSKSVELTLTAGDTGSGITEMAFSTDGITWSDWEAYEQKRTFTLPVGDGEKLVYLKVLDKAGNVAEPVYDSIILDTIAPDSLSIIINENAEYTNSVSVTASLHAEDSGSGVGMMSFNDTIAWTPWTEFESSESLILSPGDGRKFIYFNVQDKAGNIAVPVSTHIILDSISPECSIVINDNAEYTNSSLVSLSLTASDYLSGISGMAFSFDSGTWTTWEAFSPEGSVTIPNHDGEKTVYFKVQDNAGNIATSSDNIILDTTPPHSLFIIINKGATETNSTSASLRLSALDDTSGIHQMSFSTDRSSWTAWEDYSETGSYELPSGTGEKTIYFRVNDKAGNEAEPVAGIITLIGPGSSGPGSDTISESTDMLWLIILFIIIVIVIAISIAVVVSRRKKRAKETVPTQDAVTIDIGESPTPTITTPQLSPAQTYARPQLQATTTQTPTPQIAQVQPLPQLPPAQYYVPQPEVLSTPPVSTMEIPSVTPQPVIQPQPSITSTPPMSQPTPTVTTTPTQPIPQVRPTPTVQQPQPQVQPTPQLIQPQGPVVHLPDSPPQTVNTKTPHENGDQDNQEPK